MVVECGVEHCKYYKGGGMCIRKRISKWPDTGECRHYKDAEWFKRYGIEYLGPERPL